MLTVAFVQARLAWREGKRLKMMPEREPRETLLRMLPKHSIGAEIGVWRGDFSARILQIVKPKELHLVDPWKFEGGERYRHAWYGADGAGSQLAMDRIYANVAARFANEQSVFIHRVNSTSVELADSSLDWVYIDGNHLYDFVKADIEFFSRKVKSGGLITGDDYGDGGWWDGGVKRAVDEATTLGALVLKKIIGSQYVFRKHR